MTILRVGLPDGCAGPLSRAAVDAGCPVMLSAGSMFRRGRLRAPPLAVWGLDVALDSAGFVAMKQGGYRWSVEDWVEFVATNGGRRELPSPWRWWSTMDYCCEPQIAADRIEVLRRVRLTATTLGEVLRAVDWWRGEGDHLTDPMPILQGWRPEDYETSVRLTAATLAEHGREWPELVGVGSVCRRSLRGASGLLAVVGALDRALPPTVKLHLFGVKGDACAELLSEYGGRIASTDSMAWDFAARIEARQAGRKSTRASRAEYLRGWVLRQRELMRAVRPAAQLRLL